MSPARRVPRGYGAALRCIAVLLAVLAIAAAGCGDDDEASRDGGSSAGAATGSTDAARLSKEQYEEQVSAILKETEQSNEAAGTRGSREQLAAGERTIARAGDRLRALRPPAEVEAAHRDFTAGIAASAAQLARVHDAIRRGDEEEAQRLAELDEQLPPDVIAGVRRARSTFERLGYDLPIEAPGG